MPPAPEFVNTSKAYRSACRRNSVKALDGFSLRVEQGEIFGFLGPNGAGKTTAIHLALGLMFPTQGAGEMLGRPFGHAATRRRVGFLPENVALYRRTAASAARLYGALNGIHGAALRHAVARRFKELDLTSVSGRNSAKFSRCMTQRLG